MIRQVFWYAQRPIHRLAPLSGTLVADFVVIGGGVAGLAAAQWLAENVPNSRIVVLEAQYCGAGASGKSSGFITPDSELRLNQLVDRFGDQRARELWRAGASACDLIGENVRQFETDCDVVPADSMYISRDDRAFSAVREEHETRQRLGFESRLYTRENVREAVGSAEFAGALRYGGTFAIDVFGYVQGLRDLLLRQGVQIFESSPAVELDASKVRTPGGTITAAKILVCIDRFAPSLGIASNAASHAQTALIISDPLPERLGRSIFPNGPLLVWDTDLLYQYFRLTGDRRLLVGGSLLSRIYAVEESRDEVLPRYLERFIRSSFPQLNGVRFTHWWPGLIGITPDLLPMAGPDPRNPSRLLALCGAGIPWSTIAGRIAAELAVDGEADFADLFAPDRNYTDLDVVQPLVGTRATVALGNYYAKTCLAGDSERIARRKPWIGALIWGVLIGALLWAIRSANKKAARRRPSRTTDKSD